MVQDIGEVIGLVAHVAAIALLLLARDEFWAKVRRGALLKAAAVLVAGDGHRHRWSAGVCSRLFPGTWTATTGWATRLTG